MQPLLDRGWGKPEQYVDITHKRDIREYSDAELLAPSRQEAAMEILRRRSLRKNFTDWCRECGYELTRHHRLLRKRACKRGLCTKPEGW
jgi:hypothetical protein